MGRSNWESACAYGKHSAGYHSFICYGIPIVEWFSRDWNSPVGTSSGLPLRSGIYESSYQEGFETPPEGWIRSQVMNRSRGTNSGEQVDGTQYISRRGSNLFSEFRHPVPTCGILRHSQISGIIHYFAVGPRGPISISITDKKSPTRSFLLHSGQKGPLGWSITLEHLCGSLEIRPWIYPELRTPSQL
jgi:hypothetical protein